MSLHPLLLEEEIDLYALLGVDVLSDTKTIQRAYRKTALLYHPDKNPSKEAEDKFHQLSIALETLVDESLRKKYDQLWNSRLDKIRKRQELSAERRKFQDDLLRREKEYEESKRSKRDGVNAEAVLEEMRNHNKGLVAALEAKRRKSYMDAVERSGGSVNREGETRDIKRDTESRDTKTAANRDTESKPSSPSSTLKIKWSKRGKGRDLKEEDVISLFSRYGAIEHVAILSGDSGKKAKTALIEFADVSSVSAARSILDQGEVDHVLFPLLRKVG
ncbi:Curved DNA-binding protein [Yarrowia sp. E02]|nr:Curved DNA-binding protein [Yarrowia sp. E02]